MVSAQPADADDLDREWGTLVEKTLPKVQQKLRDDLLFDAIWDHVLDDRARRMLYRMTLLRRPWTWDLMPVLGKPDEPPKAAEATAKRLRSTSLLEQVDLPVMRDFAFQAAFFSASAGTSSRAERSLSSVRRLWTRIDRPA